jgi:hypothetical protein
MNDPIVDEVRRIRDEYAARFNYNLDAMFQDIKEQERRSGRVSSSRSVEPTPNPIASPAPSPPARQ